MARRSSKPPEDKSLLDKAKDVIDKVIHPEAAKQEEGPVVDPNIPLDSAREIEEAKPFAPKRNKKQSSCEESDLAKHPKFDKFKTGENKP